MKKKLHQLQITAFVNFCFINVKDKCSKNLTTYSYLNKIIGYTAVTMLLLGGCFSAVQGQVLPGTNDTGFNTTDITGPTGFDNSVSAIALQNDGKMVFIGYFDSYNGISRRGIARLNTDGSLDTSFNPGTGFIGHLTCIVLQDDGKMIIGGWYASFNGTNFNSIVRLNANGTLDTTFSSGTGFGDNSIASIVLQPDGRILVGGTFQSYNGTARNRIVRLNTDGSLDDSFNPGTGFTNSGSATASVSTIALQSDGKIVAGGNFSSYNGTSRNRIARLNADGSLDSSFNPGQGFNNRVACIKLQSNGKILAGGEFTSFNGASRNYISRLNTDGSVDTSFNPGNGFNASVIAFTLQTDEKLVVGGNFTSFNGTSRNRIARLTTDGTLDSFFNHGTGFNASIPTIALENNGNMLVGGGFTAYNGSPRSFIARLNTDSSLHDSFLPGTGFSNTGVFSLALQPDGKMIAAGTFSSFNRTLQIRIARLLTDGSVDPSFNSGTGFNSVVWSVIVQPDGKIVAGGDFTTYNGITRNRIARLNADGTLDTSFNPGSGFSGYDHNIKTIALQPDGKIIVGGEFDSYNGWTRNNIVRLNTDGSLDTSFNPGTGFNAGINSIAIQSDGKIIAGGNFTSFNGISQNFIARLHANGTVDTSFNTGTGFNGSVLTIALQNDGKAIVGGGFTSYNGTTRIVIARLNTNGSLDTSYNPGILNSYVWSVAIQSDGKAVIGGFFSSIDGTPRSGIGRLNSNGSFDTSFNPGTGFNNAVISLALQNDGKILAVGVFNTFNNTPRNGIARLHGDNNTLSAAKEQLNKDKLLIYPNPSQRDFNIIYSGPETSGTVSLSLYNALGQQVYSKDVKMQVSQEGITLSTTGLASGIYYLSITTRGGNITKRVVLSE